MTTLKTALQIIAGQLEGRPMSGGLPKALGVDHAVSTLEKAGLNLDEIEVPDEVIQNLGEGSSRNTERGN